MSSDLLLRARNVTKVYPSARRPLALFWQALWGLPLNSADSVRVLNGIDLEIRRSETVGIMGRNGAGKTTLLAILGGVLQLTEGEVERFGKVSTLLGLTAGFNNYLTGRENAYQFASVQGFPKRDTDERIADIEAFAELGKYFDMPIRTYSSGMQARLAFSCAIHVDAELIIIDETLAVGDAAFRMKCYDRIKAMKRSGQTFLLVSHSPNLVANFCTRGVVIEQGTKCFDGAVFEAVEEYKRVRTISHDSDTVRGATVKQVASATGLEGALTLEKIKLQPTVGSEEIKIVAVLSAKRDFELPVVNFGVRDQFGITVCAFSGADAPDRLASLKAGESRRLEFSLLRALLPGRYFFSAMTGEIVGDASKPQALYQNVVYFDVLGKSHLTGIADLQLRVLVH